MALVNKNAALYVRDADALNSTLAVDTVKDDEQLAQLSENIKKLGKPNSADVIAEEVLKLARKNKKQRRKWNSKISSQYISWEQVASE